VSPQLLKEQQGLSQMQYCSQSLMHSQQGLKELQALRLQGKLQRIGLQEWVEQVVLSSVGWPMSQSALWM
jgi:hypothetical protein